MCWEGIGCMSLLLYTLTSWHSSHTSVLFFCQLFICFECLSFCWKMLVPSPNWSTKYAWNSTTVQPNLENKNFKISDVDEPSRTEEVIDVALITWWPPINANRPQVIFTQQTPIVTRSGLIVAGRTCMSRMWHVVVA